MKNNLVFSLVELKESFSEVLRNKLSSIKSEIDVDFIHINKYQELIKKCDTCNAIVAEFSVYNSQLLDLFCSLRKIPLFMFIDESGNKLLKKYNIKNDAIFILKKNEEKNAEELVSIMADHFGLERVMRQV